MSKLVPTGQWYFTFTEDENWDCSGGYDTTEAALADAREVAPEEAAELFDDLSDQQNFLNGNVYIGQGYKFVPEVDPDFVIERIQEDAYDQCTEFSIGYLDGPPRNSEPGCRKKWNDQVEELGKRLTEVFTKWAEETNNEPFFTMIDDIAEHPIKETANG